MPRLGKSAAAMLLLGGLARERDSRRKTPFPAPSRRRAKRCCSPCTPRARKYTNARRAPTASRSWTFREPIATLLDDGKTVGRHYAGPNWEDNDGSAVGRQGRRQRSRHRGERYSLVEARGGFPPRQRRSHDGDDRAADQYERRQAGRRLRPARRVSRVRPTPRTMCSSARGETAHALHGDRALLEP